VIILPLAGIIAEFNPLHNGHKYLINCAKSDGFNVAVVISGNFVQRGDTAIIPKYRRAESALLSGADIVCELPVPWSMSTAQNFALGGISQLSALGIKKLYFGSECGNTAHLMKIADTLSSAEFNERIKTALNSGKTYASIRQNIIEDMIGPDFADILHNPNDALGVEYILAAKRIDCALEFCAVKRIGAGHDESEVKNNLCSSSYIRSLLLESNTSELNMLMPTESLDVLLDSPISDINKIDTAIISKIKQMTLCDISMLPDISEGLENVIYEKARTSYSYRELCEFVKSKRYTMARIRRILLSAYLGIDNTFFGSEPPYVRILALTDKGIGLLPEEKRKPIVTKVSEISTLGDAALKVFELEMKINELYALSLNKPKAFTNEYKEKLIKK
jgi:predicted nucleotidyltransferase